MYQGYGQFWLRNISLHHYSFLSKNCIYVCFSNWSNRKAELEDKGKQFDEGNEGEAECPRLARLSATKLVSLRIYWKIILENRQAKILISHTRNLMRQRMSILLLIASIRILESPFTNKFWGAGWGIASKPSRRAIALVIRILVKPRFFAITRRGWPLESPVPVLKFLSPGAEIINVPLLTHILLKKYSTFIFILCFLFNAKNTLQIFF